METEKKINVGKKFEQLYRKIVLLLSSKENTNETCWKVFFCNVCTKKIEVNMKEHGSPRNRFTNLKKIYWKNLLILHPLYFR